MIDLHTHSCCSDGTDTPEQLVQNAVAAGVEVIALTDHDTTAGIPAFLKAADGLSITAVPGIEFGSFLFTKEIHIVGLFIDHRSSALQQATEQMLAWRRERNLEIIQRLQQHGYNITEEEVLEVSGGISIGRPHIASVLVRKGYFSEIQTVFAALIGRGTPCYVQRKFYSPDKCIELIHEAGGIAIWAHAVFSQRGPGGFLRKIGRRMMGFGIDGLECYYSGYTPLQEREALKFVAQTGLLMSGGSDYHGLTHKDCELGVGYGNLNIPRSIYDNLFEYWKTKHEQTL